MVRVLGLSVLMLVLSLSASGQRLIPGQYTLDAQGGTMVWERFWDAPANFSLGIGLNRYLRGYHALSARVSYLHVHYSYRKLWVPVEDWIFSVGYQRWLLGSPDRVVLWYVGGYGCVGFEDVNGGERSIPRVGWIKNESTWVAGFLASTELNCYVTDRLQMVARGQCMVLFHSRLFPIRPMVQVGVRWCF